MGQRLCGPGPSINYTVMKLKANVTGQYAENLPSNMSSLQGKNCEAHMHNKQQGRNMVKDKISIDIKM